LSLFQHRSAEPAVAYYRAKLSILPNGRAHASYMSAFALALYGDFDKARGELSTVSWSSLPPMYEGCRAHVLAVLAILQERDYKKASELAVESRDLCSTSTFLPGSTQSRRATEALVDACDLLAGRGTDERLARLNDAARSLPGPAAVIPAWSLAHHFKQAGDKERAATYNSIVRKFAPHCEPLEEPSLTP
jgi:hypothetical protein